MSAVKNKHTWLCSALIFSALGLMQPMPHAEDAPRPAIKPNAAATTEPFQWVEGHVENDHQFTCLNSRVMVGMANKSGGDENDVTAYRCAAVHQFQQLQTSDAAWATIEDESLHTYNCPTDKVMTGRSHTGDENKVTRYQCSTVIDAWGNAMRALVDSEWTGDGDEDGYEFQCPANKVIASRQHWGDENVPPKFKCASLW